MQDLARCIHYGFLDEFKNRIKKLDSLECLDAPISLHDPSTLYHIAARWSQWQCIKILHEYGAKSINTLDNGRCTPLHDAADQSCLSTVRALVESGADSYMVKDVSGFIPLHRAAMSGNIDIVDFLIQPGTLREKSNNGLLPIHVAINQTQRECVEFLYRKMNQEKPGSGRESMMCTFGEWKQTIFHPMEYRFNRRKEFMTLLVRLGGNTFDIPDGRGRTPLSDNVKFRKKKASKILMALGCSVEESYDNILDESFVRLIRHEAYFLISLTEMLLQYI